jgi:hypothetical protein
MSFFNDIASCHLVGGAKALVAREMQRNQETANKTTSSNGAATRFEVSAQKLCAGIAPDIGA